MVNIRDGIGKALAAGDKDLAEGYLNTESVGRIDRYTTTRMVMMDFSKKGEVMKKVYVAGKLNADAVGYIKNMHRMIKTAKEARDSGYAVYVPCNDFLEGLVDGDFGYEDYFANSQPWLESADAVLLVPGWETSTGTMRELRTAASNLIPAFLDVKGMDKWFKEDDNSEMYKINMPWQEKD